MTQAGATAISAPFAQALPALQPVPSDERKRVAVIGAGVVGLSSALWLQRAGHQVTLCDPHPPLPGVPYETASSFGNACTMAYGACLPVAMPGIASQVPVMLLDRTGPLSIFWRDLPRLAPWLLAFLRASRPSEVRRIVGTLGRLLRLAEAGHAPLIAQAKAESLMRHNGCLYLFESQRSFEAARPGIAMRAEQQVAMDILDTDAIRALEPRLAPLYARGVMFRDAYSLDNPHLYLQSLARAFEQAGGHFARAQIAGMVDRDGTLALVGSVADLPLSDRVVVAAGAWSKRVSSSLNDRVRLDAERGYHVLFPESGQLLNRPTCYPASGFYMTPLSEGLRAAGTVELGGLGQAPRPVRTRVIEERARR